MACPRSNGGRPSIIKDSTPNIRFLRRQDVSADVRTDPMCYYLRINFQADSGQNLQARNGRDLTGNETKYLAG